MNPVFLLGSARNTLSNLNLTFLTQYVKPLLKFIKWISKVLLEILKNGKN